MEQFSKTEVAVLYLSEKFGLRFHFLSVQFLFCVSVRSRIWCETVVKCSSIPALMSSSAPLAFKTNDKKQSDVHKNVLLDDIQVFCLIVSFCISWLFIVSYITKAFKQINTFCVCHAKLCEENYEVSRTCRQNFGWSASSLLQKLRLEIDDMMTEIQTMESDDEKWVFTTITQRWGIMATRRKINLGVCCVSFSLFFMTPLNHCGHFHIHVHNIYHLRVV